MKKYQILLKKVKYVTFQCKQTSIIYMRHISLFLFLLITPCFCLQYTEIMPSNATYITVTADISSFNVSSDITVMVEATNSSYTSYIVATASFDYTVDDKYAELSFYETSTPSGIDLEAATFGQKQYINLVKDNVNQDALYVAIYNVNPYFRTETIEISVQVVDELQCEGCPSSSACTCDSCSSRTFGEHCSRNYQVIDGEVTEETEKKFNVGKNSFLHLILDIQNEMNIKFIQKSGSFEIYSKEAQSLNFPSYLQPAFKKNVKLYLELDDNSPLYSVGDQPKGNLVTIVTYEQEASFNITFQNPPLSMLAIILMSVLIPICFCCSVQVIGKLCQDGDGPNRSPSPLQNYQTAHFFPGYLYKQVLRTIKNDQSLQFPERKSEYNVSYTENIYDHSCSICRNSYSPHDGVKVLYCGHFFHSHCLHGWFNQNIENLRCPQCSKSHKLDEISNLYHNIMGLADQLRQEKKKTKGIEPMQKIEQAKRQKKMKIMHEVKREKKVKHSSEVNSARSEERRSEMNQQKRTQRRSQEEPVNKENLLFNILDKNYMIQR